MKILLLILITFYSVLSLTAEQVHPETPVGVYAPKITKRANLPEATVKIDGLKAVMLGGEVDGVNGTKTKSYTDYLKRVGEVLKARNVKVVEFYSPTTREAIQKELKDANFIFYAGHGIGSSNPPSYKATGSDGGMLILQNVWTGGADIKSWEVKQNAIIFFMGACFTAGNAGTDMGKIDSEEAKRRISLYSEQYLNSRFGGYYAAWSDYSIQQILGNLFIGKTLGESYGDIKAMSGVTQFAHPKSSGNTIYFHQGGSGNNMVFDYAFAGKPEKKLTDLFGAANSNITPDPVKPEEIKPIVYDEKKSLDLVRSIYKANSKSALDALEAGANPNAVYNKWSALLLAVNFNQEEVVLKLIEKKANVNFETEGWTPIMLAEELKLDKIAEILKNAGATKGRAMQIGNKPKPAKSPK
jgi:hypothetical protein